MHMVSVLVRVTAHDRQKKRGEKESAQEQQQESKRSRMAACNYALIPRACSLMTITRDDYYGKWIPCRAPSARILEAKSKQNKGEIDGMDNDEKWALTTP